MPEVYLPKIRILAKQRQFEEENNLPAPGTIWVGAIKMEGNYLIINVVNITNINITKSTGVKEYTMRFEDRGSKNHPKRQEFHDWTKRHIGQQIMIFFNNEDTDAWKLKTFTLVAGKGRQRETREFNLHQKPRRLP